MARIFTAATRLVKLMDGRPWTDTQFPNVCQITPARVDRLRRAKLSYTLGVVWRPTYRYRFLRRLVNCLARDRVDLPCNVGEPSKIRSLWGEPLLDTVPEAIIKSPSQRPCRPSLAFSQLVEGLREKNEPALLRCALLGNTWEYQNQ